VRFMEKLPSSARRPSGTDALPDMFLMLADTLLVFDNLTQGVKVLVNVHMSDGADAGKAYDDAVLKINGIIQRLLAPDAEGPVPAAISIPRRNPAMKSGSALSGNEFTSSFGKKGEFMDAVDKAKEYIKAGDILQVVLSQRFEKKTQADPFDIYRALRVINPSPYMYYLDSGDAKLVGSSPEILVRLEGPEITVRPIAGTRRRGRDEAEDKALEAEMKADPKEIAEHVMLLDLGRNDIGRVSATGSVKPAQIMTTERYSHVMHMVSTVTGTLREGLSGMDVLRAAFPAGTVTGAPKVRAMEIIEELEPVRRGPYAGAVGYLSYSGNLDTCITIRTLIIKEGAVYVQAGAGLVADSVPELEYKETVNKAMAMMEAVKAAEKSFSGGQQPPKR
ncbi:MAG: chorismate-binding protein, partial [Nitrospiraceae bacterium]|nr:chorismate-binding protein [Nitrospiraceae bacterium]